MKKKTIVIFLVNMGVNAGTAVYSCSIYEYYLGDVYTAMSEVTHDPLSDATLCRSALGWIDLF